MAEIKSELRPMISPDTIAQKLRFAFTGKSNEDISYSIVEIAKQVSQQYEVIQQLVKSNNELEQRLAQLENNP